MIVAEIGADMSVFPSSRHLASLGAASAPGNNESAGKRKHRRARGNGSPWLRSALDRVRARRHPQPDGYLAAQYWRVRPRRGHNNAP